MSRRSWALGAFLLVQGCGDDGHVVGDMASGGSGGSESVASSTTGSGATNTSAPAGSTNGSGGSSTATTRGNTSSTTSAAGGSASGTTAAGGTSGGGSSAGGSSAGGASAGGTSAGGASSTGGTATTGAGGTGGQCPEGQMWCPGCSVGEGSCGVACPGAACVDCSYVDNEADCDARYDCHSVYEDPNTCGCAGVGCCAHFAFCATGASADCVGADLACTVQSPFCEAPAFVTSYAGACFEGCVKPEECATPPGTGGAGGSGGGTSGDVCPCDPDSCPNGEQLCLMGDTCVVADGPQNNGICRGSDGTCFYCECASPDTPIATASGDRAIRDLRVGDLVYSVHHDAIVLVPIRDINRVPVTHHRVLKVEFADGAHFEMSGGHPTAEGQPLSELRVGQRLGGERVTRITEIAYQHPFTYDILPDSDTGSYFADGVLMGSTLFRGSTPPGSRP